MILYEEYSKIVEENSLRSNLVAKRDKHLILIGMDACTHKEEAVIKHTKNALDEGVTIEEIVEVLMAAIVSRGLTAWLVGVKAIEFAREYQKNKEVAEETTSVKEIQDIEEAKTYLAGENGAISNWASLMEDYNTDALLNYTRLRTNLLRDGKLSRKQKEFVIIGINLALGYKTGLDVHIEAAKKQGATDDEINEVFKTAFVHIGLNTIIESK